MIKKTLLTLSLFAATTFLAAPAQAATSCNEMKPLDTQFRVSGSERWVSGGAISDAKLAAGTKIDVNCFAKNGGALMENTFIELKDAAGKTSTVSNTAELRNWAIPAVSGKYTFACRSAQFDNCSNTDSFSVKVAAGATPKPTPVVTPTPAPTPQPPVRPTDGKSQCEALTVASGNNSQVPAKVVLRARASDNRGAIQKYKFFFGDGQQSETDNIEVEHKYESSGSFVARVDIKDSQGVWKSSSSCETTVSVKNSPLESHKSNCSDLFITSGNLTQAPTTVQFKVSGYDNKSGLKRYKIDFGNGIVKESDGQTFEQRYEQAGTYTVKAYVLDSKDSWKGGDRSCQQTLYVNTKPLTRQPQTGTPTWFSVVGLSAGGLGLLAYQLKKRLWLS